MRLFLFTPQQSYIPLTLQQFHRQVLEVCKNGIIISTHVRRVLTSPTEVLQVPADGGRHFVFCPCF